MVAFVGECSVRNRDSYSVAYQVSLAIDTEDRKPADSSPSSGRLGEGIVGIRGEALQGVGGACLDL